MAKIFNWDARFGTLIDSVSRTAGTLTIGNGGFRETEKGKAMLFDGADTKIDTGLAHADLDLTGNVTFVVWMKPFSLGELNQGRLFDNGKCWCHINTSNNLRFRSDGVGSLDSSTNSISFNKYNHILITRTSNGTTTYYINGNLNTSGSSGTPIAGTTDFIIGNILSGIVSFEGPIAKVEIHNKILDAQECVKCYKEFLHSYNLAVQKVNPINYNINKPTDLSNETGLVAAYNMIPQNGTLVDISGNGNTGTLNNNPLSTLEGIKFGADGQNVQIADNTLFDGATAQTICLSIKPENITSNDGLIVSRGTELNGLIASIPGVVQYRVNTTSVTVSNVINTSDWFNICAIWDGSTQNAKIYINGVKELDDDLAETTMSVDDFWKIAFDDAAVDRVFDGQIRDVRMCNRVISEQEVKDYHNSFANQVSLLEDFRYENADGANVTPIGWSKGTGSYKIGELTAQDSVLKGLDIGRKYMECTSVGTIVIQQEEAYGTWELDLYKGGAGTQPDVAIISDLNITKLSSNDAYWIEFGNDEAIYLIRFSGGGSAIVMSTTTSYIEINTNYRIKVTRTTDGEFTLYIKGGSFGDIYTLIDVSGGSGTNPATSTAVTTSKYFVGDLDIGDRICCIKKQSGVKQ